MLYEKELEELLYSTGVFHSCNGYRIFILAVDLAVREPWRMDNICQNIYLPVAKEYGKKVKSVEKAMQNVCRTIMDNGGMPFLKKLGGGIYWDVVTPYPREIICIFARYLRNLNVKQQDVKSQDVNQL